MRMMVVMSCITACRVLEGNVCRLASEPADALSAASMARALVARRSFTPVRSMSVACTIDWLMLSVANVRSASRCSLV